MSDTQSYVVYLTEEAGTDFDDPIHADAVDFYDSGVWVTHVDGRDFFPYRRVRRIREGGVESAAENEAAGERRDAASGTAGTVDDTDLEVE